MISPDKVEEYAKENEEKNYTFRIFLKSHVDSEELDELIHTYHRDLFEKYDCSKCRNCCKKLRGQFEDYELDICSKHLNMSKQEFIDKYLTFDKDERAYVCKNIPCDLFVNNECILNDCKPSSCKEYPFTLRDQRLEHFYGFIDTVSICPVSYEIMELLKKHYNFK